MKTVQNTSVQSSEYRDLPLTQLVESPTNPRKRYNPASLEELAQSFRSRGVLEPILVRPIQPDQFCLNRYFSTSSIAPTLRSMTHRNRQPRNGSSWTRLGVSSATRRSGCTSSKR